MSDCPWSIRPFPNETQVDCERDVHLPPPTPEAAQHKGVLRGYAFPGSETVVAWYAGDRREFEGNWPGYCTQLGSHGGRQNCTLPAGHRGNHAP